MSSSKTLAFMLTALATSLSFAITGNVSGAVPSSSGATVAAAPVAGGELDALSGTCLTCHDGSLARFIAARPAGTPTPYDGHRSLDHPVGMLYRDYPARDPGSYRYPLSLDPSVQLIDGKVACVSCHRLRPEYAYNMDDVPTDIDNGGQPACMASPELAHDAQAGGLCLACHVL
jgi:cytochrome c peroxidase